MSTLQVIEIEYIYQENREVALQPILKRLQNEVGGESKPYWIRASAIDLLTFLEIIISFVAGAAVSPVVQKYFEGLLNTDAVKKLGEEHRQQLFDWFSKLEKDLETVIQAFHREYESIGPITFKRKPERQQCALILVPNPYTLL